MLVVENDVAPALPTTNIGGYGSRIALRLSGTTKIVLAARCARSFAFRWPSARWRAQGRPGARRTRGLVCNVHLENAHTSIQVWRRHPAFPAQWLYGLYVVALVTGFLATIIPEKHLLLTNLTPAPGRQALTTSPYAAGALVFRTAASTASHPASVTIAKRPPSGTGPIRYIGDLGWSSIGISENQKLAGRSARMRR